MQERTQAGEIPQETSKKNFWILFAVWFAAAAVLPSLFKAANSYLALSQVMGGSGNPALRGAVRVVGFLLPTWSVLVLLPAVGSGLLIYIAARFRFRRCLWLALAGAGYQMADSAVYDLWIGRTPYMGEMSARLYVNSLFNVLLGGAVLLASVAAVRLLVRLLRREWAVALCSAAVLFAVGLIRISISSFYEMHYVFAQMGNAGDVRGTGEVRSLFTLFTQLPRMLLTSLLALCLYALVRLVSTNDGREKLRLAGRGIRTFAQKAWDATAR